MPEPVSKYITGGFNHAAIRKSKCPYKYRVKSDKQEMPIVRRFTKYNKYILTSACCAKNNTSNAMLLYRQSVIKAAKVLC
jgi:hypothetical protein